jgi:hypothetical protein
VSESTKQIIEHIRRQIIRNILAGPMPPPEEMPLLSQEYRAVWKSEDEDQGDESWRALLDAPGGPAPKPRTPEEHVFDQKTRELQRRKRRMESEQLAALARIEKLLAGDRQLEDEVARHNQQLTQQIEMYQKECDKAATPDQAEAARRRLLECQRARRSNLRKLAELDRTREKVLAGMRRNAMDYLGMVKSLEARREYRRLSHERKRAARGGLGILSTLGMALFAHRFQQMADGINKLAKKK